MNAIKALIVLVLLLCTQPLHAQWMSINNTGAAPDPNAALDISSNSKGLLIPRLTKSERLAMSTPTNGLLIFQTDGVEGFYFSKNGAWKLLTDADYATNDADADSTNELELPTSPNTGDMAYWNGSAWVSIAATANDSATLQFISGVPTWVGGVLYGTITALACSTATTTDTLIENTAATGVTSTIAYTGGNGGTYYTQTISSTGVTGLTATLAAGSFASGSGSLVYTITGTPASSGTASFALNIGGQTCTLNLTVDAAAPSYPAGTVHCNGPTAVIEVTNPTTGKIWMDRNLGASQAATSSTDAASYGDLYQWGRRADGHQCRTSATTSTLSSSDQPAHGNFILAPNSPYDWRSPQNTNLWQGVNGVNNPCPSGYRLPTNAELDAERLSWISNNSAGAFVSPLKLPVAGRRYYSNGSLFNVGSIGFYWSSTVSGTLAYDLYFNSSNAFMDSNLRASGISVRCLKD